MNAIERRVVLPPGAQPLDRYARFYADGPGGEVKGVYVGLPPPEWPHGTRGWVRSIDDLPMIDDGGCSSSALSTIPRNARCTTWLRGSTTPGRSD